MQLVFRLSFLLCTCIFVSSAELQGVEVRNFTVNATHKITEVELSFLSLAIDSEVIAKDFKRVHFTSPKFIALCEGLFKINTNMLEPEVYLRMGGSKGDDVIFKEKGLDVENGTYVLNHTEWDSLNMFIMKMHWKLVFGLNSLLRRKDGSWDPTNAIALLRYTQSQGYLVNYELGNEPDLYLGHRNISIAPEQLARDFATLQIVLQEETTGAPLIIGPDVATLDRDQYFGKYLANVEEGVLDAITYHFYYGASENATLHNFTDPLYLDKFMRKTLEAKSKIAMFPATKDTPIWVGETANTYGGGKAHLSNTFAAGFLWLDKLGLAARLNISVVIRQTLVGGEYALLDKDLNPTPDYWLSLLHKQLAGHRVLNVTNSLEPGRSVRVYAHCVNEFADHHYDRGDVTILAVNINATSNVFFNLTGTLKGLAADQYLLQAQDGDVTSQNVLLNGNLLQMIDDTTLPKIEPLSVEQPFHLPAWSYGFFVIKNAKMAICL